MTVALHRPVAPSEGLYKDKGSSFIAYLFPVSIESEADVHLQDIRKKHWDSRHVCFAWRMGPHGENMKAYDAGEPAHSAGDPILNALRSAGLTWTLLIVVRYFGGTKLGVPGLIHAYGEAARDAISQAETVEYVPVTRVLIRFPYERSAVVNQLIHRYSPRILETQYDTDCRFVLEIREDTYQDFVASCLPHGIFVGTPDL